MEKENLFAHIENLAPGLVTLLLLSSRIPATTDIIPNTKVFELIQQQFITGLIVIAFAYLLGVFIFIISRFVIDTLSALTFRPIFLKLYRWDDFNSMWPKAINQQYRHVVKSALALDKENSQRQEVVLRRQRGRLLRTLVFPLLIFIYPSFGLLMALLAVLIIVAIYAYSELAIYQEAKN